MIRDEIRKAAQDLSRKIATEGLVHPMASRGQMMTMFVSYRIPYAVTSPVIY